MTRRNRFDDDYEDEEPRRRRRAQNYEDWDDRPQGKPGLATTAGVFWLIWAVLLLGVFLIRIIGVVLAGAADEDMLLVCGGMDLLLVFGIAAWAGLAGLMTVLGKAHSLTAYGVLSLILPPAMVLMETAMAFFIGIEIGRGRQGLRGDLPLVLAFRSFIINGVLVSGVILAGIFALSANRRYREWRWRR